MDNTKDFIAEEAFKLFLNHSYEAVSISTISNAIGFTKGALYHHFRSKEELFIYVIDKYLYIPEAIVDEESISLSEYIDHCYETSKKIINNIFKFSIVYTPINYVSMFADAIRHYPGYLELKGVFFTNEISKTKKVLENAILTGEIRNDINTDLIAMNYFSVLMGLAGNLLVRNISVEETLLLLKEQLHEFYKMLKK